MGFGKQNDDEVEEERHEHEKRIRVTDPHVGKNFLEELKQLLIYRFRIFTDEVRVDKSACWWNGRKNERWRFKDSDKEVDKGLKTETESVATILVVVEFAHRILKVDADTER